MRKRRWIYGLTGVVVMLFAGLVYAWSVLARPISEFFTEWSSTELSFTFTLCMMFFCLGGLITGLLSEKFTPKIRLKLSAVLFLVGFFFSSRAEDIITLYIGYGIIAGLASRLAYKSIMGNITKFFQNCPGLISGILLMGFGFGSFLIGRVYQVVTPYGIGVDKWRYSFLVFGVILFVIMLVSSFFIRRSTKVEIEDITRNMKHRILEKKTEQLELPPGKVLKTTSFWMFFMWATLLSASGLAIVSQANGVAMEVNKEAYADIISIVVGLISIFNGVGRVIFGGLFDRIRRLKTMILNNMIFLLSIFILIIICFITIGLSYGGTTLTNSAFVNEFYGSKNYSVSLSLINMNLFVVSFGSTIAGLLYDASGSYFSTLITMIIAVVVGFTFTIKESNKKGNESTFNSFKVKSKKI